MVITSTSNEQIKKLIQLKEKSKIRKTTGTFTVEGKKMFVEIPAEDLVSVYVSETFLKENGELVKDKKYQIVSDQVFKKISDTVTPQGIVAVVKQKSYSIDYIIEKRNKEKGKRKSKKKIGKESRIQTDRYEYCIFPEIYF